MYFSPVHPDTPALVSDDGLKDADMRELSSKCDLHRLGDKNLWLLSDMVIELNDHFEFEDRKGKRILVGRYGQVAISRKLHKIIESS